MRLLGTTDALVADQPVEEPAIPRTSRKKRWIHWPSLTIDLSSGKHRRRVLISLISLVFVGIAVLAMGVWSYDYVESAAFCGTVCHPMESEFARYQHSPHSNIDCAQCHVGRGVSSFVQSKIDGVKDLYFELTKAYVRPIKSPVHDLRPARETCEECHKPTSFKDNIIKTIVHHDNDAANTPVQSTLILKMGGWQEATGMSEGIHWHITTRSTMWPRTSNGRSFYGSARNNRMAL
jgi:nitrate/TMAO reductase-like tetraheme cytochrome c subunit